MGLKAAMEFKRTFTKELLQTLPDFENASGNNVTKNNLSRQSRLVPELIFQVSL